MTRRPSTPTGPFPNLLSEKDSLRPKASASASITPPDRRSSLRHPPRKHHLLPPRRTERHKSRRLIRHRHRPYPPGRGPTNPTPTKTKAAVSPDKDRYRHLDYYNSLSGRQCSQSPTPSPPRVRAGAGAGNRPGGPRRFGGGTGNIARRSTKLHDLHCLGLV